MMTETRIETYIPLYRKYRPQSFADLVGQEAIAQTLGNAIQLSKVAHAYLFCGPRGTGKTSTARIFAKSLNCEQGPTVSPCQQCASCLGIVQGNALDVVEFDAASNNGVADARELIENCQYSSMTGRFKVYIIDEVHMLTTAAFNALLKTLEEPPANVIFIFATTEAHKVLPTIISRCQRFDFNRITTENIISRLRYISEQESIAIDAEALLTIARHARGGLRDAVGLLDQVAVLGRAQQDKVISRKDVALFIGALEEDLLLHLGGAIAERRAADLLSELNALLSRGIEPIQLLKDLTTHFRNLLIVSTAGPHINPETLSLPPDYFEQLIAQAKLFPEPEEIPQIIGRLAFVERNIRNSNQPQLWLEVGLIELAYRHEIHLVKELSERVARLEAQLSGQAPLPPPMAHTMPAPSRAQSAPVASRPAPAQTAPAATMPAARPQTTTSQPMPAPVAGSMPQPAAQSQNIPSAQPAAAHAANAPVGVVAGSLEAQYQQACALIPGLPFRSLLQQQTFAVALVDDLLTVGCVSETHQTTLKKPEKLIHLQRAVDKAFGRPMRIEVILEKKRPVGPAAPAPVSPAISPVAVAPATAPVMPSAQQHSALSVAASDRVESAGVTPEPIRASAGSATAVMEPPVAAAPVNPAAMSFESAPPAAMVIPDTFPVIAMSDVRPAGPPQADEMPPMDVDEPPPMDDEDDAPMMTGSGSAADAGRSASGASAMNAQMAVSALGGDHDLNEAKKNALDLFQGRIID